MLEYHSVFCKKVYVKIKNILQSRKGKNGKPAVLSFAVSSYKTHARNGICLA